MITNKDIRVENGYLIINGNKYPLEGQSPEAIMQIVEDNSDSTPTAESTAPVTSAGIKTYVDTAIGDLTQTGITGASVAAQLGALKTSIKGLNVQDITITDNLNPINPNSYEQYTINITRQGYMPLAVCGVSYTGGVGADIARFYNSSTTASLLLHNVTANTYTPDSLTVSILYIEV